MILPCEVAVKTVLPAVKALMARELAEEHNLKQDQIAEMLGISQSAVSKYTCRVRGYTINLEDLKEIQPLISNMITILMDNTYQRAEFLQLFCRTCKTIRSKRLMCGFCGKSDLNLKIEECNFCTNADAQEK